MDKKEETQAPSPSQKGIYITSASPAFQTTLCVRPRRSHFLSLHWFPLPLFCSRNLPSQARPQEAPGKETCAEKAPRPDFQGDPGQPPAGPESVPPTEAKAQGGSELTGEGRQERRFGQAAGPGRRSRRRSCEPRSPCCGPARRPPAQTSRALRAPGEGARHARLGGSGLEAGGWTLRAHVGFVLAGVPLCRQASHPPSA